MPVVSKEVKTYMEFYDCDDCGEQMVFNGMMLSSIPPQYGHECKNRHFQNLNQRYPKVVHR